MKSLKDELQHIITQDGRVGAESKLKKVQNVLRRNAKASNRTEKQKSFKSEEEIKLIDFIERENLLYSDEISESNFISEGAEQRVFWFDAYHVIKLNDGIFYECWLDYFNNLLIHNYFFRSTAYDFLGFKIIDNILYAVVKQDYIKDADPADTTIVRNHLEFNHFRNIRNNDYINEDLGIILEDAHDENVLSKNGILYFIDTVFYFSSSLVKTMHFSARL